MITRPLLALATLIAIALPSRGGRRIAVGRGLSLRGASDRGASARPAPVALRLAPGPAAGRSPPRRLGPQRPERGAAARRARRGGPVRSPHAAVHRRGRLERPPRAARQGRALAPDALRRRRHVQAAGGQGHRLRRGRLCPAEPRGLAPGGRPRLRAGGVAGRGLRPGARGAGGAGLPGAQGLDQRLRERRRVPLGRQAARAPGDRAGVAARPGRPRALGRAATGPRAPARVTVRSVRQRGPQPGAAPHHPRPDRDQRAARAAGLADLRVDLCHRRLGADLG